MTHDAASIEDLIAKVNDKKAEAYEYLYQRYYAALCSYVSQLLKEGEEVEDLVQEVFVSIYEGEHRFEDVRELTNYLYKACYNNCLSYIRNHKVHDAALLAMAAKDEEEADEETVYALTIREELIRQLYHYIKELPSQQRRIIMLRIEGYEWNEIAEQLGLSINTVKTQRLRSFRFLREKMKNSEFAVLLFFF
jgi:RNA polymerase sigma-70 factor, ECF subfamily